MNVASRKEPDAVDKCSGRQMAPGFKLKIGAIETLVKLPEIAARELEHL
jgi:hypothetical protein